MFRKKALEKLSSPDRLDQLLRVVKPRGWIQLGALAIGLALAIAWSIFETVPIVASGVAVIVRPKAVRDFGATSTGQIHWLVQPGDEVSADTSPPFALANIEQADLKDQLKKEEKRLEQFLEHAEEIYRMREEQVREEHRLIDRQKQLVGERKSSVMLATWNLALARMQNSRRRRESTVNIRRLVEGASAEFKELELAMDRLVKDRKIDRVAYADMKQRHIESETALAQLRAQQQTAELYEMQLSEYLVRQFHYVSDLEHQHSELELKERGLDRELAELDLENKEKLQEIQRNVEFLRGQWSQRSVVTLPQGARVIEMMVANRQLVSKGMKIGRYVIDDREADLKVLAYFPVKDGKRITMKDGKVIGGDFPEIQVTPSTVRRSREGSIRGTIQGRSKYPVTTDHVAFLLGDRELARTLLGSTSKIQVEATLNRAGGFWQWTSGKPNADIPIEPGTTATVRVKVAEKHPIDLLIPSLREALGGQ